MAMETAISLFTGREQLDFGTDADIDAAVRTLMSTGAVQVKILMNSKQRLRDAVDTLPACFKILACDY
jgi:hypothetical protein